MPITTRSQSGREGDGSQTTSQNTSNPTTSAESSATGSGTTTTATTTTSGATTTTQDTTLKPSKAPSRPPSRAPSRRSTASRKRLLAELEAKESVAELEREQLRVATEIARLRLAKIQAEMESSDEEEEKEDQEESSVRVEEWLKKQDEERRATSPPPRTKREAPRTNVRGQDDHRSGPQGKEEPGPARHISELAEAITQAMRSVTREAPKYIQELPIFNGQSNAWLPFKAAYEDTSKGFTNTENIARLRRSLRGAALEAVQSLLLSNPEPGVIIATLERRFGRPEAIVLGEMDKIRTLQKIGDNPRDLLLFANKIANIVATVEALKKIEYLYNPEMARNVVDKLSPILRSKWFDYAARNKEDIPELKRLAAFLNEEADKCGAYASLENIHEEKFKKRTQERTLNMNANTLRCPACDGPHNLHDCKKFLAASTDERWEIAKKSRVCFRCLRNNHRHSDCRAKACGHQGCTISHHKLLHQSRPKTEEPPRSEEPPRRTQEPPHREKVGSTYEDANNTASNGTARRAYLKIVPVVLTAANGNEVETFALLDEGSTITIIDEKITQELNVDGPADPMRVRGVSGTELQYPKSKRINLKIRGKHADETFDLRDARTVRGLDFATQRVTRRDVEDCPHLNQIQNELVYEEAHPKLLIGQDNWDLIISGAVRAGRKDKPVASYTRLGWVLHGCRSSLAYPVTFCGHISLEEEHEDNMENMMKNYFELESIGIEKRVQKSDPEQRALKILDETSRRLPDGRFETRLLWREDEMKIPNNYENSLKRLHNLEKKLDRDEDLKQKYEERMRNLFTSGYAEEATTPPVPNKTWYLPHFAVINPAKPKIRVVHDAAAKTAGRSLNDMLLSGPDLLQSLPGVVMRFRQHQHAVSADIKEMFMQIRVQEDDRDALRFLWRGDERGNQRPREYRMTSVIFGATSSPCTALYVKNRNASDFKEEYPAAARAIEKNHYMDDYITSFPTASEAKEVSKTVDYIHRQAGFELRGWVSNTTSVVQQFAADSGGATVSIGGSEAEKTLGLLWDVKTDCIGFKLNTHKTPKEVLGAERPPTKREALSIIMSLFDPLGLVSPVTTPAKRIMQETWRYGTSWDEPLPNELQNKWYEWLRVLRNIEELRIPRCYDIEPASARDLHTFVDASEEAYAAAVYWRIERADGSVQVALAAAKSRVTPLKPISIPRLELQAALLGARLADTTAREHEFDVRRKYYWSDSRTALAWIRSEPRAYKTFVAHRLAEIEDLTKKNEWRWLPTADNVADDATRATPAGFNATHRWYNGPSFLRQQEQEWPRETKTEAPKTGEERETCHVTHQRPDHAHLPRVERFSSFTRLLRATARVLQFIDLCRKKKNETVLATKRKRTKENKKNDADWNKNKKNDKKTRKSETTYVKKRDSNIIGIEAHYLIRAEKLWWKAVQEDCFYEDLRRVRSGAAPHLGDKLSALSVVIGEDGVLRLKGRIHASPDIDEETASPTVLDGKHFFTRLYIQHVHERLHHGGIETVVNELRQRLWVLKIRPTVRDVIKHCQPCKIRRAKPTSPATGDLPPARVSHHARAFSFTGLDYFGPVEVTVGRHHEKRWVALFTCMTSRAVHLEVAASLSADSAICALRRFVARRGVPKELWSDNATCFKAAEKELAEAALAAVSEEATARRITWRYVPPASPFMAGAWERMVRTVKEALRVTLHEQYPSDETLLTLLAEAENTVNSRPLTHVAVTPEEPEALTPNHILVGPNSHVPPPGEFTADDLTARKHWRRAQRLADVFWSRWVKEYQPLLQQRREPHTTGAPPAVGDLVLICDPNLPRNTWPRGRVVAIYPGRDGEVRIVDVETSNGHVLRRPTKRIVVLPVGSQSCDGGRNVHDRT